MKKSKRKSRTRGRRMLLVDQSSNNSSDSFGQFSYKTGIPMKDRQLPASFWQQPDRPCNNIRRTIDPQLSPHEVLFETRTMFIRIPTPPDTNLLFSLFKILDHSSLPNGSSSNRTGSASRSRRLRSQRYRTDPYENINHNNNNLIQVDMNKVDEMKVATAADNNGNISEDNDEDVDFHMSEPNTIQLTSEAIDHHHRHHQRRTQRLSDDDPYLSVGSKDRRVGLMDEKKSLMRFGDNFSDLLSDLVVNL